MCPIRDVRRCFICAGPGEKLRFGGCLPLFTTPAVDDSRCVSGRFPNWGAAGLDTNIGRKTFQAPPFYKGGACVEGGGKGGGRGGNSRTDQGTPNGRSAFTPAGLIGRRPSPRAKRKAKEYRPAVPAGSQRRPTDKGHPCRCPSEFPGVRGKIQDPAVPGRIRAPSHLPYPHRPPSQAARSGRQPAVVRSRTSGSRWPRDGAGRTSRPRGTPRCPAARRCC